MNMTPSRDGRANTNRAPSEPDAHGQAALLLAESTIHMLVETGTLTSAQAITVVRTAAEVKVEVAQLAGESNERMNASLDLLERILARLGSDADGKQPGLDSI